MKLPGVKLNDEGRKNFPSSSSLADEISTLISDVTLDVVAGDTVIRGIVVGVVATEVIVSESDFEVVTEA